MRRMLAGTDIIVINRQDADTIIRMCEELTSEHSLRMKMIEEGKWELIQELRSCVLDLDDNMK